MKLQRTAKRLLRTLKNKKIDAIILQAVPVEIKKTEQFEIPADVLGETIDTFTKAGYLGKDNKPSAPMKEALKQGVDALKLPERTEYARQEIYNSLNNQYATPNISNEENNTTAIAKREVIFSDPFNKLWDKIKTKTRYKIEMNDDMLKAQALMEINSNKWAYVNKVKIVYEDAQIGVNASGVRATSNTESTLQTIESKHRIPDILRNVGEQCNISKKLAFDIFVACNKTERFLNNPQVFMEQFIACVKKAKSRMEVANIIYLPTGSSWDYAQVFDNFAEFNVNKVTNAVEVEHSLYNYIKYDSEKVELEFAERIDRDDNVELFLKLPTKKYTISTPVGSYTPDWAIVKRDVHGRHQTIYFVVETKGTSDDMMLREIEDIKIQCAKEHYKALGFEVVEEKPLDEKDSKYVRKQDYKGFALDS